MLNNLRQLSSSSFFQSSKSNIIGLGLNKTLAFFLSIYLANKFGAEDFGVYAIIRATLISIGTIIVFGQGSIVNKIISSHSSISKKQTIFYSLLVLVAFFGLCVSVLVTFNSDWIAEFMKVPSFKGYHKLLYLSIIPIACELLFQSALVALRLNKELIRVNGLQGLFVFVFAIIGSIIDGIYGALFGYSFAIVCSNVVMFKIIFKDFNFHYDRALYFREAGVRNQVIPVAMQETLFTLTSYAVSILISNNMGHSIFGSYSVIIQWVALSSIIVTVLRNPIIASATDSERGLKTILKRAVILIIIFIICFSVLAFFFIPILGLYPFFGRDISLLIACAIALSLPKQIMGIMVSVAVLRDLAWHLFVTRILRDIFILLVLFYFLSKLSLVNVFVIEALIQLVFLISFLMVTRRMH